MMASESAVKVTKFLLERYGDDAVRSLQEWVDQQRSGPNQPTDADLADLTSIEDGIKQALVELKRPYDEFFGPRVGDVKPDSVPPTPVATFPFGVARGTHPLGWPEAGLLTPADKIYTRIDGTPKWLVLSAEDYAQGVDNSPFLEVWKLDPVQVGGNVPAPPASTTFPYRTTITGVPPWFRLNGSVPDPHSVIWREGAKDRWIVFEPDFRGEVAPAHGWLREFPYGEVRGLYHPLQWNEAFTHQLLHSGDKIFKRRDGVAQWMVMSAHDASNGPDMKLWVLDPVQFEG